MASNAASRVEKPAGFKINFYACLYYKSEFVKGEYAALFLQNALFFLEHFVILQ